MIALLFLAHAMKDLKDCEKVSVTRMKSYIISSGIHCNDPGVIAMRWALELAEDYRYPVRQIRLNGVVEDASHKLTRNDLASMWEIFSGRTTVVRLKRTLALEMINYLKFGTWIVDNTTIAMTDLAEQMRAPYGFPESFACLGNVGDIPMHVLAYISTFCIGSISNRLNRFGCVNHAFRAAALSVITKIYVTNLNVGAFSLYLLSRVRHVVMSGLFNVANLTYLKKHLPISQIKSITINIRSIDMFFRIEKHLVRGAVFRSLTSLKFRMSHLFGGEPHKMYDVESLDRLRKIDLSLCFPSLTNVIMPPSLLLVESLLPQITSLKIRMWGPWDCLFGTHLHLSSFPKMTSLKYFGWFADIPLDSADKTYLSNIIQQCERVIIGYDAMRFVISILTKRIANKTPPSPLRFLCIRGVFQKHTTGEDFVYVKRHARVLARNRCSWNEFMDMADKIEARDALM